MLKAMQCIVVTTAVYALLGAIVHWFDKIRSWAAIFRHHPHWSVHFILLGLRRLFRWINWEKLSTFSLALSLALVLGLTVFVPGADPIGACDPACPEHCTIHEAQIDTGIYGGLQTVFSVFEGDSAAFREHLTAAAEKTEAQLWEMLLRVFAWALPVLVPLSAVGATLTLLWNYLPHHVPILSRTWYIFSGLDPYSIRMAKSIHEDLLEKWETGVFIFLRTRRGKASAEDLEEIKKINYLLYPGDEARFLRLHHRRRRKLRFYFLSEKTDENFERMQEFLKTAETRKNLFYPVDERKEAPFQQELYLLSETESAPMLIDHLRKNLKDKDCFRNTELYLLDRFRATSYDLLENCPLQSHIRDGKLRVLVLGFGQIGRAFFRAACHLGVDSRCKPEFTLCDVQICEKLNRFRSQYPELDESVTFRPLKLDADTDALDTLLEKQDYHYILVALGEDERNIRVASRLKRLYRLRYWEYKAKRRTTDLQPQICVNLEDSIKHSYTEDLWKKKYTGDHALYVFGGLDQVFTEAVLIPRNLHRAARWIHRQLNRSKSTGEINEKGNWGEYERRSSIACALHAKLHAGTFDPDYLDLLKTWSQDDYDHLIDTEHQRWMAYVRSEGLRKADPDIMAAYYLENGSHHVDIVGKLTPCLTERTDLEKLWKKLAADPNKSYSDQYSFRERDELLVLNAKIIAQIIETGNLPDRAITERT